MKLFKLSKLIYFIYSFLFTFLFLIIIIFYLFVNVNIPLFIFCSILISIIFIVFFSIALKVFIIKQKNISSDIEKKIFGKRLLLIETFLESAKNNKNIYEKIKQIIQQNENYNYLIKREKQKLFISSIIFLILFSLFINIIFITLNSVKKKNENIKSFLNSKFNVIIPEHYLINSVIKIELPDYEKYEKTLIFISNIIFEIRTNEFLISEKWTQDEELKIKILAKKYGITKTIFNNKLKGTNKFIPLKLTTSISYKFFTEPITFSGIKDIEVYKKSIIQLSGEMSKNIKDIIIDNANTTFTNSTFLITLKPEKSRKLNLKLIAFDNDVFEIKDINIKLIPNQPPEIKIEFPKEDVILTFFPWKLITLLRGIDDQGIKKIIVNTVVENESSYLKNLGYKKEFIYDTPISREIELKLTYSPIDIELLPGDKATFYIKALDVFDTPSKTVKFSIYSPGFEWMDKMRENKLSELSSTISNIYNKSNIFDLEGSTIEKEKTLKEISNLQESLNEIEKYFSKEMSYEETKEIIDKMKEISKKLEDFLKNKDEFFLPLNKDKDILEPRFEKPEEFLWQMEKLLDQLNKQKEIMKKFSSLDEMKIFLNELKKEKDIEKFNKKLSSYQEMIKSKKNDFNKDLMKELEEESKKLNPADEKSFNKSFEILDKIKEELELTKKQKKENTKKITEDILTIMLEEVILCNMLIEELKDSIPENFSLPENSVTITRTLKASVLNLKKIYKEKLGFYFMVYKNYYKPLSIIEKLEKDITDIEDHLRERRNFNFTLSLPRIINDFNNLYFLLKDFVSFINSSEFENITEKTKSISLDNLLKMQQLITSGLKKMLSEKQGSPEYQQLKDELEKLQKAINQKWSELLKEGNFSGVKDIEKDMEDILKDIIEEKVTEKTIEKSKKLEEKLLNSKKGLINKGLEEERKAEKGKEYEIKPPDEIFFKPEIKKDFKELTNKNIPFYYKILIEKYKNEIEK